MKHIRRILALLLCMTLLTAGAFARDYGSAIDSIFTTYTSGDNNAETVYQQMANGAYRSFEFSS